MPARTAIDLNQVVDLEIEDAETLLDHFIGTPHLQKSDREELSKIKHLFEIDPIWWELPNQKHQSHLSTTCGCGCG